MMEPIYCPVVGEIMDCEDCPWWKDGECTYSIQAEDELLEEGEEGYYP